MGRVRWMEDASVAMSRPKHVRGHQEVAAWGRDEAGDKSHQIIVHVAGVAQRGSAGRHDLLGTHDSDTDK